MLSSDNRSLYWELRKEIKEYCPARHIIDVCYMNTTFEMRRYEQNDVRVATLESCAREIYDRNISGHVAEAGVYQGGFAQYVNKLFSDRSLFLFDTFEGFDQKDCKVDIANGYSWANQDWSDTNVQLVLNKMKYKEKCIIRKGFFPDTATDISEDEFFCFVSLDMDLYQPIYEGLKFFYPRLSEGGYIFVHDCRNIGYLGARQAVQDYCQENHIGYVVLPDEWGTAVITK